MPKVSVIVPSYNHAHFLPQAVQSVFDQTMQEFEIIVIDDGSTDNTREVAQSYTDGRFKYIYQENRGLSASRNTGLGVARGEYVAFLDADDIFMPNKLQAQLDGFEAHPSCGMMLGGYYALNEQGEPVKAIEPWTDVPTLEIENWLFHCPVSPNAVLVKKCWVDQVGGFDERFRRVEDWDLWLRMAYAGCQTGWVKEIVSGYRLSPEQMTKNAASQKNVSLQVMDKFFQQDHLPTELNALKPEVYTRIYTKFAPQEYSVGQLEDARESVAQAIKFTPDILSTRQSELMNPLVSFAYTPHVADPIDYIKRVFDNLPEEAADLRTKKRGALGEVAIDTFFRAYQEKNWPQVRRAAAILAVNAPQRMLNQGVWSILWQSLGK